MSTNFNTEPLPADVGDQGNAPAQSAPAPAVTAVQSPTQTSSTPPGPNASPAAPPPVSQGPAVSPHGLDGKPVMSKEQADAALKAGYLTPTGHAFIHGQHSVHDSGAVDPNPGLTDKLQGMVKSAQGELSGDPHQLVGKSSGQTGGNVVRAEQGFQDTELQSNRQALDAYQKDDADRRTDLSKGYTDLALSTQKQTALDEAHYQANLADQNKRMDVQDAATKSLMAQKVDPEKFFHDKGAGRTIMMGIGAALAAGGAALTHSDNGAMKLIQQGIDKSVEAQQDELANKREALSQQAGSLRDRVSNAAADAIHRTNMRAEGYATARAVLDAHAAGLQDPAQKLQAAQLRAQLTHQIASNTTQSARYQQQLQSGHEQAEAGAAAHQLARGEKAFDTATAQQNELQKVGATAAGQIDVNAAKPGAGLKGPQANLKSSVDDLEGYADDGGEYPDTTFLARHLPGAMVSDRDEAFRSSVDQAAAAGMKQLGRRPVGKDAKEQNDNTRITIFGSATPNAAQLKAGILRLKNLAKNPNQGQSDVEPPGE